MLEPCGVRSSMLARVPVPLYGREASGAKIGCALGIGQQLAGPGRPEDDDRKALSKGLDEAKT
jgi:hypothetical protein